MSLNQPEYALQLQTPEYFVTPPPEVYEYAYALDRADQAYTHADATAVVRLDISNKKGHLREEYAELLSEQSVRDVDTIRSVAQALLGIVAAKGAMLARHPKSAYAEVQQAAFPAEVTDLGPGLLIFDAWHHESPEGVRLPTFEERLAWDDAYEQRKPWRSNSTVARMCFVQNTDGTMPRVRTEVSDPYEYEQRKFGVTSRTRDVLAYAHYTELGDQFGVAMTQERAQQFTEFLAQFQPTEVAVDNRDAYL